MKKQVWSGLIAATACSMVIGLSAQGSSTSSTPQTRSSSPSASDQITVTGCLQRDTASATPGATGTSGSTSSASKSDTKFVLNVTPASSSSPSTSSTTSSTPSAAGTAGAASSYRLDADDAKLTPHVGHKVEITGTLDKSSSSTAPSGSTSSAASPSSSSMAPKLKVDSVRMIASSCSN